MNSEQLKRGDIVRSVINKSGVLYRVAQAGPRRLKLIAQCPFTSPATVSRNACSSLGAERKQPMNWTPFDEKLGANQPLPPRYKRVLVALPENFDGHGAAAATAVGYLKFGAGDPNSPYFVTPGVGGKPTHWLDCLPDDFGEPGKHPYWRFGVGLNGKSYG